MQTAHQRKRSGSVHGRLNPLHTLWPSDARGPPFIYAKYHFPILYANDRPKSGKGFSSNHFIFN